MADSLASGSLGGDIISRGASPRSEHQLCEVTGITGLPDDGAEVHVQASLDFLDTRRTVQPLDGGFQYAAVASKLCVPAFHLLTGCMPPLTPGLAEAVRAGRTSHLPAPPAAEEVPPEGLRAASAFWGGFSRMDAWVPLVAPLDFTPDGQQEHVLWHPASCSMVGRRPALAQAHAHPRGSARDRRMVVSTPVSRRSSPGSSARGLRLRGRRQSISSAGDAASEGMEGLDGTDDDPDEAHAALLPDMSPRTGPAFMPVGSRPGAPTFGQPAGTSVSGAGFARMPPLDAAGSRHAVRSASSRGLRPRHPANGHSFGAMSIGSGAESAGVETAGGSSGGAGLEASEYAAAADDRVICGQLLFRGQTRVSRRFWVTRFVVVDEDDCTLARYKDEQDYEWREGAGAPLPGMGPVEPGMPCDGAKPRALLMRAVEASERDDWLRVFVHAGCKQEAALGQGGAQAARAALGHGPAAPPVAPPPLPAAGRAVSPSGSLEVPSSPASAAASGEADGDPSSRPGVAGWLEKRGERNLLGMRKWRRRFCVLEAGVLCYYLSEEAWRYGAPPRRGRLLPVSEFSVTAVVPRTLTGLARSSLSHPGYFCLVPLPGAAASSVHTRRVWEFRASDSSARSEWLFALADHGAVGSASPGGEDFGGPGPRAETGAHSGGPSPAGNQHRP